MSLTGRKTCVKVCYKANPGDQAGVLLQNSRYMYQNQAIELIGFSDADF
jgi:hypothetical protein